LASESHAWWRNTVPRYGTRPRDHALRPLEGSVEAVSTLRGMRVAVNSDLCQGHNRCYALAPELFDVDDYGNAIVLGDGSVSADLEEKARLAVANCPEYAISIDEGAGS
jgi:ferredoxin